AQGPEDRRHHAQRFALPPAGHQARQTDPDQIDNAPAAPRASFIVGRLKETISKGRFWLATVFPSQALFFHAKHSQKSRPPGPAFSLGAVAAQRPSAAMPALATWASSFDLTPLTPTAP